MCCIKEYMYLMMGRCFTVSKKDYMGENRGFKSFFYMIFFFPLQNVKNVVMGGYF